VFSPVLQFVYVPTMARFSNRLVKAAARVPQAWEFAIILLQAM